MKSIVLFSNASEKSPSIRYRMLYPLEQLKKNLKLEYQYVSFFSQKTESILSSTNQVKKILFALLDVLKFLVKITKVSKHSNIIIKNYIFPFGGGEIEKIFLSCFSPRQIYYDIDDAIYLNQTRKQNEIFRKFRNSSSKVQFWVKKADKIFVSNEIIIKDLMELYAIPKERFVEFLSCPYKNQYFNKSNEISKYKINDEIRILWLGSPHTQNNLYIFDEFFKKVPKYIPNVKVILMGTSDDFSKYDQLKHIEVIEWTLENEREEMRKAHFGLNPLINEDFEKRKSAFKVIQYYRAGIIPIVSDVGINDNLICKYGGFCYKESDTYLSICRFISKMRENYLDISISLYENTEELSMERNAEIINREIIDL